MYGKLAQRTFQAGDETATKMGVKVHYANVMSILMM